jgi:hypothetical protein
MAVVALLDRRLFDRAYFRRSALDALFLFILESALQIQLQTEIIQLRSFQGFHQENYCTFFSQRKVHNTL